MAYTNEILELKHHWDHNPFRMRWPNSNYSNAMNREFSGMWFVETEHNVEIVDQT